MIYVYSDGSSTGRIGAGGWSYVMVQDDEVIYAGYGGCDNTTNNLQELNGAICGLHHLLDYPIDDNDGITLVSDSQYVLGIADGSYTPRKNIDVCLRLRTYAVVLGIKCQWVRGHSGNVYNEIADSLARMGKCGYSKPRNPKRVVKKKRRTAAREAAKLDVG